MSRNAWFAVVVALCLLGGVAYVGFAVQRARGAQVAAAPPGELLHAFSADLATPTAGGTATPTGAGSAFRGTGDYIVFLDGTIPLDPRLAIASLDNPDGPREVTSLGCNRVYFAAGSGICLTTQGPLRNGLSKVLDARLEPTAELDTPGLPSRTRVASSGRYAATTTFVKGDSYAQAGFSTRTQIIELATRSVLYDMENVTVTRNGAVFSQPDFNFWGVTFAADGDTYYATLGTQTATYLVKGSISARTAQVIFDGVECPSLSPDQTRIAFKHFIGRGGATTVWHVNVLDLRTMQVTELESETRSVDDQVEWLDNDHLLYSLVRPGGRNAFRETDRFAYDIWSLRTDGTEKPQLFMQNAASPAIVRGAASRP